MEYQKIINLLDNTPNQPSKFIEQKIGLKEMMNHVERIILISQIRFKASMITVMHRYLLRNYNNSKHCSWSRHK